MKIGILTLRPVYNYGGILQCLALQETLRDMGHDVSVISFKSNHRGTIVRRIKLFLTDFTFREYGSWAYSWLSERFERIIGKRVARTPKKLMENCRRFMNERICFTNDCDETQIGIFIKEEGFDAIVIGSDKVWGGLGHSQLTYFGDWQPMFQGILISYAACSSVKRVPCFNRKKIGTLLSHFNALSVRDEYTAGLFRPYSTANIRVMPDPVILYDFDRFVQKPESGSDYIFTYILGKEIKGTHRAAIAEMKAQFGNIPVKAIVFRNQATDIVRYADEVIDDADPEQWISLLANARIVYTDSFHASVFAIKYQRKLFAYFSERTRSTRLVDMRDTFGLDCCIVDSVADAKHKNTVRSEPDYTYIACRMQEMRKEALEFLTENLRK